MASTVVVTKMFTPTASNSIVPRPLRSRPAEITSFAGLHSGSHNSINLSNGAKIGISAGAAVVVAALVGLVIFCFLRRRRARKYRKIGGGSVDDKLAAHHLTPFQTHRGVPAPTHGAGAAFEPMRGGDSPEYRQEYKQPYMMSPPQRSASPNKQPLMDSVELFRSSTSESPPRDIELSQVSPRLHASTAAQAPASANMELTHENDITHQRNTSPFASHSRRSS
ncbi:hypothetical protein BS50DRAFT_103576 [Corynespora cassiicola Philippines]|uniref:Mid2 domain-containing protein n=1 Tax=Corynespora cassiicola Philippines TaxID=1448308 RepID=A0A2T2NC86_CORCC|nr:hypothetical protein BS50DRAFT_103576 [Corynespora cassiicola Philippines]